ncbi:MAG: hypothetical protein ACXWX9_08130 [Actinomycetota bacterium]
MHARRRRFIAVLTTSVVAGMALVTVPTAGATSARWFRADVDGVPDPVAAGSTATIRVTLFNDSWHDPIGSSDVRAPAGYGLPAQTIALSPPKTVTIVGSTIKLRNLWIAPRSSFSFDVTATVPCSGNAPWSVDAKKKADHSYGSFTLKTSGSDLVSDVAGTCHLGFVTQPANAELASATSSDAITGAAYDPGGPSVAVEVLDGANARVTTSTAAISLALGGGPGGATLLLDGSAPVTAAAVDGVATFAPLTVDLVGLDYTLGATSPGLDPAVSGTFNVVQEGLICASATCAAPTIANPTNTTTGSVRASNVPVGTDLSVAYTGDDPCAGTGYVPTSPDTFTVLALDAAGEPSEQVVLDITLFVSKHLVRQFTDRGASHFQVCFATDVAGKTFVDRSGDEVTQGLLPDCHHWHSIDCVVKRKKDRAGNVTVVFRVLDGRGKI